MLELTGIKDLDNIIYDYKNQLEQDYKYYLIDELNEIYPMNNLKNILNHKYIFYFNNEKNYWDDVNVTRYDTIEKILKKYNDFDKIINKYYDKIYKTYLSSGVSKLLNIRICHLKLYNKYFYLNKIEKEMRIHFNLEVKIDEDISYWWDVSNIVV